MMNSAVQDTDPTATASRHPTVRPTAPTADPGALGLAAFALTTFVLSFVNAGLLPVTAEPVVFGLALFLAFVFLTVTFFALAAGDCTGTIGFTRVGGVLGIVTALLAWYASSAVVINSTHQRIVLPVGPQ